MLPQSVPTSEWLQDLIVFVRCLGFLLNSKRVRDKRFVPWQLHNVNGSCTLRCNGEQIHYSKSGAFYPMRWHMISGAMFLHANVWILQIYSINQNYMPLHTTSQLVRLCQGLTGQNEEFPERWHLLSLFQRSYSDARKKGKQCISIRKPHKPQRALEI